jgi:hypothetical protein
MPDRGSKYKSIEEVRSILYPRRPGLLNLQKEDVLEFPANLTGESRAEQYECGTVVGDPSGCSIHDGPGAGYSREKGNVAPEFSSGNPRYRCGGFHAYARKVASGTRYPFSVPSACGPQIR